MLNLEEREGTAHSFCGKKAAWDEKKKKTDIIIIIMTVGERE